MFIPVVPPDGGFNGPVNVPLTRVEVRLVMVMVNAGFWKPPVISGWAKNVAPVPSI